MNSITRINRINRKLNSRLSFIFLDINKVEPIRLVTSYGVSELRIGSISITHIIKTQILQ